MKLWLLSVRENEEHVWSYDMNYGCVIRAETEGDARTLAETERGFEPKGAWLNSDYTTCEELIAAGKPGIILEDYHAG